MELRPLGRTGRMVSRIGLGLAALGRPGYLNLGHGDDLGGGRTPDDMRLRTEEVLDAAFASGVRSFDAARSYGRAEEFLAGWLTSRGIATGSVTVGSKWGYTYVADWQVDVSAHEVKDHGIATFARQLVETRDLLGDQLDLYQVHSATLESGILDDDAVLGALADLRDSGVAVGLSTSGPTQDVVIRRAVTIERAGRPLFSTVQSTWNLLEPSAGPALRDAHDHGVGIIVKEALANGRLTDRNPNLDATTASVLDRVAGPGVARDTAALAAVLAQDWVDVVLSGATTVEQLHTNVAAASLAGVDVHAIDRLTCTDESVADYWTTRSAMPWT